MDNAVEEPPKRPLSTREKWVLAALIGTIAIICFGPISFVLSQRVGSFVGVKMLRKDTPTGLGLTLHVVFFILIIRLLMH
jgi:hypothetical protein